MPLMRIAFYAPFKPLDHPEPSGDRIIGTGIHRFLTQRGHRLWTASRLRLRWIYRKPWLWPVLFREHRRITRRLARGPVDLWLTYHSYYKAPDLMGPWISRRAGIPYVLFQGIYATKRRRGLGTLPGYLLNTAALRAADHVFANKRTDHENLARIIPPDRLTYLAPGIFPEDFQRDPAAGESLRKSWRAGDDPVVLSAAMFRPDVKTQGLVWLIQALGVLAGSGRRFVLAIAGDGKERGRLEALARRHLPGRVRFVGRVPREHMVRFYSAGDVFAFPGIRESLGMVYLEAQSCGLPVVAFDNGGIPEVVDRGTTGFLVPMYSTNRFVHAIQRLLDDPGLRRQMGGNAARHVRTRHDLNRNYRVMERRLMQIAQKKPPGRCP